MALKGILMPDTLHRTKYGTYHAGPGSDVAWAVNDTRGYMDEGPHCDGCGGCDYSKESCEAEECAGLSFAYVCLDGGESYCEECFDKLTDKPEIVECNC